MAEENLFIKGIDIERLSRECLAKLNECLEQNFEALRDKFLTSFEQYCQKIRLMQEDGKKGSLSFIHLSVLRTNILDRRHMLRLDAYDENWYADRAECSGEMDVHEFYGRLDEFADALFAGAKATYGRSNIKEIQRTVFDEGNKYLAVVAEFVRACMKTAAKTEWFNAVCRNEVFAVCIGEFQDRSDILYKEDTTIKDAGTVKQHLEEKLLVYTHEICENLDLSGGNYQDIRLLFSDFAGCDFSGSDFTGAAIISGDFKRAVIKNADMKNVTVIDTDFEDAVLENVNFDGAALRHVSFAGARLTNIVFDGALTAEDLDFDRAMLTDTVIPDNR